MNTKKRGIAHILIYRTKFAYKAVCLDFDLYEEGESLVAAQKKITNLTMDYIENVCKNNLDDSLLNRKAPKKYWNLYKNFEKLEEDIKKNTKKKSVRAPFVLEIPINAQLCNALV